MNIEILTVRKSPRGHPIGYGRIGEQYGEVWLAPDISQPGVYHLARRLVVREGRFVVQLRAEKP